MHSTEGLNLEKFKSYKIEKGIQSRALNLIEASLISLNEQLSAQSIKTSFDWTNIFYSFY